MAEDFSTIPANLNYQILYDQSSIYPINAGYYQVSVIIEDSNYYGQENAVMVIEKAPVSIHFADLRQVYDMQPHQPSISLSDSVNYSVSFNGYVTSSVVNAGVYNVVVNITDSNYIGCDSALFTIAKAQALFDIQDTIIGYNGQEQSATIQVSPSFTNYEVLYEGNVQLPINAGIYKGNIVIKDTNIIGDTTFNFYILPLSVNVIVEDTIHVYDGTPKSISVQTSDSVAFNVVYYQNDIAVEPINAGRYDVEIYITEPNYDPQPFHYSLLIEKAPAEIHFGNLSFVYDNTPKSVEVITNPENLNVTITYNGSMELPIATGNYLVTAVIDDTNYQGFANDTLYIIDNTNIQEKETVQWIANIYPNPTKGQATLSIEQISDNCNIHILDIQGKIVHQEHITNTNGTLTYQVNISNLKNGVYFIRIQSDKTSIVKKLIKE